MTLATLIEQAKNDREGWKYTSLHALHAVAFAPAPAASLQAADLPAPLDAQGQRLVFINGFYQAALSTLTELPSDFITETTAQHYQLTVQAQTCLATAPLEILFISSKAAVAQQSHTQITLLLGAHARVTMLEQHLSIGQGAAHAARITMKCALAEQAKLLHVRIQAQAQTDYHLAQTHVSLAKGAYFDQFALTTGAALSRHDVTVSLTAPEAQTRLHGVYLLREAQHGDTTTLIHHQAPQTTSSEQYRGVLDGQARGVFQGKIIVDPHAQKTDGRQMSRVLLLSDQAEANNKPELEIYADDVQCSHGATIGQLDDTALFYLRSRGIPHPQARALLIEAFVTEVIESISTEAGRAIILQRAQEWYPS